MVNLGSFIARRRDKSGVKALIKAFRFDFNRDFLADDTLDTMFCHWLEWTQSAEHFISAWREYAKGKRKKEKAHEATDSSLRFAQ